MIRARQKDLIVCIVLDLFIAVVLNETFNLKKKPKKRNNEFTDFHKRNLKSKLMSSRLQKRK